MKSEAQANVSAKALQLAIKDLETISPKPGLLKSLVMTAAFLGTSFLSLSSHSTQVFLVFGFLSGLIAGALIVLTHDAIHHTLTGWKFFDEVGPRLVSAPLIWVHGIYSEIHKIHHKMNGDDLNDPERVQWTEAEYKSSSKIVKFYVRNQWFFDIFIFAGLGMIYKTSRQGLKHYSKSRGVRRQCWLDLSGILLINGMIYTVAIQHSLGLKYFLFWVILERTTGAIVQWRAHIEHYGLWGKSHHFFETQVFNCRNLITNPLTSWYFNRLNYHSVHHAFPRVPFYNLKAAHERFVRLYENSEPLVQNRGYLSTTFRLALCPTVIGQQIASSRRGQRVMISI